MRESTPLDPAPKACVLSPRHDGRAPEKDPPLRRARRAWARRIVPFAGWEMPVQYTGIVDEHTGGAQGRRPLRRLAHGRARDDAASTRSRSSTTSSRTTSKKLADGQALYTCCCNEHGTILDDLIVYRATQERYLIVCNASNREKIVAALREGRARTTATFEDRSDETALIALQGPKAFDVLALAGRDAAALASAQGFHFRDAVVGNVRAPSRAPATPARTASRSSARGRTRRALARAPRARQAARRSSPPASARATRCASRRASRSTATTSTRRPTRSRPASAG